MRWLKRGFIYGPDARLPWASHSALTPTPVLLGEIIRVFAGFRDGLGVSRIGYVDVAADNPSRVLCVSPVPSLDIGEPGAFDDNGVILGDVVPDGDSWRMYYVGFQQVAKAKFLAFTGLATSDAECRAFSRVRRVPVLERSHDGMFIRAIHTIRKEGNCWKAWFASGNSWTMIDGKPYPCYEVRYVESDDGLRFDRRETLCLSPIGREYRLGRPRVRATRDGYDMLFTVGDTSGSYMPGFASSLDGVYWMRDDARAGFELSPAGWDSRTLCYPACITVNSRTWAFYNGNEMGRAGFGYAELTDD